MLFSAAYTFSFQTVEYLAQSKRQALKLVTLSYLPSAEAALEPAANVVTNA